MLLESYKGAAALSLVAGLDLQLSLPIFLRTCVHQEQFDHLFFFFICFSSGYSSNWPNDPLNE